MIYFLPKLPSSMREPNAQGKLIFTFAPRLNYAMVNAIEVVDEGWK
jgi:hypothetical protein